MEIRQDPEILNESPYENGWILELEIGAEDDLDSLMDYNDVLDSFHEETEDEDFDEDDEDDEDKVDNLDEDEDFNY